MKKKSELKVGCTFKHWPGKTITESDNNIFCLMTMNHHPIHIDSLYSQKTRFKKKLVVGTYVFSLVVGMTVKDISLSAIANLGYEKITHLRPVFIGDTLYAKSKVLSKRKSKKNNKNYVIEIETFAENQKKKNIIYFKRFILI